MLFYYGHTVIRMGAQTRNNTEYPAEMATEVVIEVQKFKYGWDNGS